jgi:hypothetical protein
MCLIDKFECDESVAEVMVDGCRPKEAGPQRARFHLGEPFRLLNDDVHVAAGGTVAAELIDTDAVVAGG